MRDGSLTIVEVRLIVAMLMTLRFGDIRLFVVGESCI